MLRPVNRLAIPDDITLLAQARARARADRDWPTADALKARLDEAGWRVVDDGLTWSLVPARAADVEDAGRLCYGAPDSVPSRADEPDIPGACVLVTVDAGSSGRSRRPGGRAADGLAGHAPDRRRTAPGDA